jgi:hypothetical protein
VYVSRTLFVTLVLVTVAGLVVVSTEEGRSGIRSFAGGDVKVTEVECVTSSRDLSTAWTLEAAMPGGFPNSHEIYVEVDKAQSHFRLRNGQSYRFRVIVPRSRTREVHMWVRAGITVYHRNLPSNCPGPK